MWSRSHACVGICRSCQTDTGLFGGTLCDLCTSRLQGPLSVWSQHLNAVVADRFVTADEEVHLRRLQHQLGLTDADIAPLLPKLMRAKALSAALAGPVPTIAVPVMLPHGEVGHYAFQATLCTTVYTEEYVRATASRTVRLARGVSFRTGGSRGRWVTQAHARTTPGTLVVTNHRIWFVPRMAAPQQMPLKALLSFNFADDGILFHFSDGSTGGGIFLVPDGEFVAAAVFGAKQRLEHWEIQRHLAVEAERAAVESTRLAEITARQEAEAQREHVRRTAAARIYKGMTKQQLLDEFGEPAAAEEKALKKATKHVFKYFPQGKGRFRLKVVLEDGVVVSWTGELA